MPVAIRTDTEALQAFGKAMRQASKEVKRDLYKAVQKGVKNAEPEVRKSAVAILPKGGGLNEWAAKVNVRARQSYNGAGAGVTLVGSRTKGGRQRTFGRKAEMRRLNQGVTAHAVWGKFPWRNPGHLILQNVPAGFFDKAITGPVLNNVQREVYIALEKTIDKLL